MDLENAIWRCPGDNMKRGNDFRVPLSKPAVDLIITIERSPKVSTFLCNQEKMSSNNCMLYTLTEWATEKKSRLMVTTMRDWAGEKTLFSERIVGMSEMRLNAVEAASKLSREA